jgi:putative tryptophan/tyrosine transport system substrate-binding protein
MAMLAGAAALAGDVPMLVWAQQVLARAPDEKPRVVLLSAGDDTDSAIRSSVVAFERGMRTAGWTAGANVRLDYRWAGTDPQRATAAGAEVPDLKPTVIVTVGAEPRPRAI